MSAVEFDVVEGMHCAACVKRMQTALAGQPGVSDVQIDLIGRRVAMQLSPRGLDVAAVQARLGKFGFTVRPLMTRLPASTTDEVSRAVIAGAMAAACMVWAMAAAHHPASPWVQMVLVTVTMAWPGRTLLARAGRSLLHLRGDMDVLVGLGAVAAMVHGLAGLWLGWPHLHFESAAAIIAFTLAGRALESRGRAAAGAAVEALLARQPLQASRLLPDGSDERIPAARVRIDDRLRVHPGDVLPADGLVESGGGEVDEALLSGEPLPVAKGVGDAVHAGTINLLGSMVMRVGAASGATRLDAIAAAMRAAAAAKPPIARLADRVAAVFVPLAILLALATVAGWWWLGGPEGWRIGIIAGMSVLVIACPCALGLATPAAVAVAVGRAARAGILIRDGAAIETLAVVRAAVIDKTGTITTGMPQLAEAVCAPGCDRATLLTLAAAAESGSEHPVARAVLLAAQGLQVPASEGFAATPGGGIRAVVAGGEVLVGTRAFLGGHGIAVPPSEPRGPGMLAHVAANGRWIGVLRLGDGPRPAAQHELARLRALGLRLHLASGDRVAEAQRVAAAVGIGDAHGGMSPEAKARLVEDLERAGDRVLAVGDGINDAPMLARASAGAAVGGGAEIAALAGNLILHGRDPLALAADAVELARATMRTIRRNLLFAAGYNLIAIPLAASGRLDPMWASAAMASSSLCVIASSLLLARWRRRA